jgi:dTDP-4-dehydrorhamnose reductase
MRLLVTGAAGMLGTDVVAAAAGHDVIALARADLDITDQAAVDAAVRTHEPDAIINCAAWTDVDGAETAEEAATRINGHGPRHLAVAAASRDIRLVHVSTDYVFPGDATEPYREDAETGPIGAYGRSKLYGELAVATRGQAIVRTAWLFGPHGKNFVDTMLRVGAGRDEVRVVADQLGCPTYTGHLAPALVEIAERRLKGVLHVAGGGSCTWWELCVAAYERAGLGTTVHKQTTAEFGAPAPRPAYSVLGSTRRDAPVLPPWQDGLAAHLTAREALTT